MYTIAYIVVSQYSHEYMREIVEVIFVGFTLSTLLPFFFTLSPFRFWYLFLHPFRSFSLRQWMVSPFLYQSCRFRFRAE